jgi:hypothetical protein
MIEAKLIELRDPSAEKPELDILLNGFANDAQRKAVIEAFHTFAQGDPDSFNVQFAVLLEAHARALKSAPEWLRKAIAMELTQVSDLIVSHRSAMKDSAAAIAKDASDIRDQVVLLSEFNQELRELVNKVQGSEVAACESFLVLISREIKKIQDAAEAIISISEKRILLAILAVYLLGIGSYPVFLGMITWLEKIL